MVLASVVTIIKVTRRVWDYQGTFADLSLIPNVATLEM
jgi:hypothetical protein